MAVVIDFDVLNSDLIDRFWTESKTSIRRRHWCKQLMEDLEFFLSILQ